MSYFVCENVGKTQHPLTTLPMIAIYFIASLLPVNKTSSQGLILSSSLYQRFHKLRGRGNLFLSLPGSAG